ncbi:MAG: hypothetical protein M3345_01435 [Actinomycetota bacterium]|nr:hypothetical protein [Actinomycetota bacterium]
MSRRTAVGRQAGWVVLFATAILATGVALAYRATVLFVGFIGSLEGFRIG